ncbi:MAG: SDR family oxidoreductase [Bacteroidales bacterium]|nr:SDR family oxidoreductase [Bacteroidales bacterium]
MDLKLNSLLFVVCGATNGFGLAITKLLVSEGASVIAVARGKERLEKLRKEYPSNIEAVEGDITLSDTLTKLSELLVNRVPDGILVNAGGPPAMKFEETTIHHWDEAYHNLLRWKAELVQTFLPAILKRGYGRLVFIESAAVKQPLENLVLSNSLRLAVVGMVKTLSQEFPDRGVTFNILAPGYHQTAAVERLIRKKAENEGISFDVAKSMMEQALPMKKTGDVSDFATLAVWLLSPLSGYVNGQVFAVDGGIIRSTL